MENQIIEMSYEEKLRSLTPLCRMYIAMRDVYEETRSRCIAWEYCRGYEADKNKLKLEKEQLEQCRKVLDEFEAMMAADGQDVPHYKAVL